MIRCLICLNYKTRISYLGRPGYDTYSAIVSLAHQLDSVKENELIGLILMTGSFKIQGLL